MIKVAIVEDTDAIRVRLEDVIKRHAEFYLVRSYFNAVQAIADIHKHHVDVVLMDVSMPGLNGIEAVGMLREQMPDTQFLMITVHDDDETVLTALRSGAGGYILKHSTDDEVVEAIRDLHNGSSPLSHDVTRHVVSALHKKNTYDHKVNTLSVREKEIFKLLCDGLTYDDMATRLFVSKETVKKHVHHIYDKLGVQSRAEAISRYTR